MLRTTLRWRVGVLTFDVRIYKLRIRASRRRPFSVRWRVAATDHSESYQFEAQADGRRAELMAALRLGEQFDTATGLPAAELRARNRVTWYEHAVEHAQVKWPRISAKHRAGIADALATMTTALNHALRTEPGSEESAGGTTRSIPIPPDLVLLLRTHLDHYGIAPDGRLFRAVRGGRVASTEYSNIWSAARQHSLSTRDAEAPFAQVPYCLRHAGMWITAGIAPAEAARRAGHSPTVLYRIYAKPLRGHQHHANQLIAAALRDIHE